jgi:hypothetical protein
VLVYSGDVPMEGVDCVNRAFLACLANDREHTIPGCFR